MEVELFSLQLKCFQMMGLHGVNVVKHPKLLNAIQLFGLFSICFCFVTEGSFIIENCKDVLAVTEAASPMFTEVLTFTKLAAIYFSKGKIYVLIDEMRKMSAASEVLYPEEIKWVKKVDRTVTTLFLICGSSSGAFYCSLNMIVTFVNMAFKQGEFDYPLPFKGSFPYDVTFWHWYIITYTLHFYATYVTILLAIGVGSLLFSMCLSIGIHYDLLKKSFDGDKAKFVTTHQKLIDFTRRLSDVFRSVVFIDFAVTAIILCVTGFQVLISDSFRQRLTAVFLGFSILTSLFMLALGGHILTEKGLSLAEDIYEQDKDMVIIIARSQVPSEIDGWFYKANLATFGRVLSSTSSFIAVLKSFLD